MELISSSTVTDLIANVSSGVTTTGANLWVIVALAVSIPLTFYVIGKVIGLFPGTSKRRA